MNVTAIIGEVLTAPSIYKMQDGGESIVFFVVRVPGIKEDWDAKAYDENIPVAIPFKIIGTTYNRLSRGALTQVNGALRRGRYPNLAGTWEITVGINASDVKMLNKERFYKNKEAAKKQFKPRGENKDE